jgi:predicted phosphodiesterase
MRYGIIGDIHSNLEALDAAIEGLSREKIDEYPSVGDIVGYGADPGACVEKTRNLCSHIIRGNHDAAIAGVLNLKYFTDEARQAILWTERNTNGPDIAFLRNLSLLYKNEHLALAHGTLNEPEAFHYMHDRQAAQKTFDLMETAVCFIGHTHVPAIFTYNGKNIGFYYSETVKVNKNEKLIVNVGSVGQPRDGDPRSCVAVYDTLKGLIEFKRASYDVEKAQRKTLKAGLSPFLAYRLAAGV